MRRRRLWILFVRDVAPCQTTRSNQSEVGVARSCPANVAVDRGRADAAATAAAAAAGPPPPRQQV